MVFYVVSVLPVVSDCQDSALHKVSFTTQIHIDQNILSDQTGREASENLSSLLCKRYAELFIGVPWEIITSGFPPIAKSNLFLLCSSHSLTHLLSHSLSLCFQFPLIFVFKQEAFLTSARFLSLFPPSFLLSFELWTLYFSFSEHLLQLANNTHQIFTNC